MASSTTQGKTRLYGPDKSQIVKASKNTTSGTEAAGTGSLVNATQLGDSIDKTSIHQGLGQDDSSAFYLLTSDSEILTREPKKIVAIGTWEQRPSKLEGLIMNVTGNHDISKVIGLDIVAMQIKGVEKDATSGEVSNILDVHGYPYVRYENGKEGTHYDTRFDVPFTLRDNKIGANIEDEGVRDNSLYKLDMKHFAPVQTKGGKFVGMVDIDEIERWIEQYEEEAIQFLTNKGIDPKKLEEHVKELVVRRIENETFLGFTRKGKYKLLDAQAYFEDGKGKRQKLLRSERIGIEHPEIRFDPDFASAWGLEIPELKIGSIAAQRNKERTYGVDSQEEVIVVQNPSRFRAYASAAKKLWEHTPKGVKYVGASLLALGLAGKACNSCDGCGSKSGNADGGIAAVVDSGVSVATDSGVNTPVVPHPDAATVYADSGVARLVDAGVITQDAGRSLDAAVAEVRETGVSGPVKKITIKGTNAFDPYKAAIIDAANGIYKNQLGSFKSGETCKYEYEVGSMNSDNTFNLDSVSVHEYGTVGTVCDNILEKALKPITKLSDTNTGVMRFDVVMRGK
ncbi:MAG TPA: hypothetical protein VJI68_02040 [Candidatus Nanoarchaeia archaeon]|nr:hypothetical protein [Candidatus Nanoarchaeia archaeon]